MTLEEAYVFVGIPVLLVCAALVGLALQNYWLKRQDHGSK